ncbi:receptor-like serine/threonine-protein kinase ALE2 isoform X2 [Mercurialis annua]|uniref:receptor-like serine/threonine-protein kinase ALE2 isoform X2 n=1 Tax=Mercurialis annua TaxID=3986 RepID=UPI00215EA1F2|nr:receptor-like serine/threonine-protein kinase ALE2 isoform X2 [Mercurialis annua]
MGVVVVPPIIQLMKFFLIAFVFTVQRSAGSNISPPPAFFSEISPTEGPLPIGSDLNSPLSPPKSSPLPPEVRGTVPSPSIAAANAPDNRASPPFNYTAAPAPLIAEGHELHIPPNASGRKAPIIQSPVFPPASPPSDNLIHDSPVIHPVAPETSPIINASTPESTAPSAHKKEAFIPVASPPREAGQNHLSPHPIAPAKMPFVPPVVSPTGEFSGHSPASLPEESPSTLPGPAPDVSHTSSPPPSIDWKRFGIPVAAPPSETPNQLPSVSHPPSKAPSTSHGTWHLNHGPVPSLLPPESPLSKRNHTSASSPSIPSHNQHHPRTSTGSPAPAFSPPSPKQQGPAVSPFIPASRRTHYAPPSLSPGSPVSALHPFPTPVINIPPAPSPSPSSPEASGWTKMPVLSPQVSPLGPSPRTPKRPFKPPVHAFPPPPPNEDCSETVCVEPYTNTPPGSPCGCVLPMQVGLRLSVALYTFFPLVSELAQELAAGVFMKQSQVRIMGANAASQEPEKTIVLVDLVPLGERFDNTTASLTFQRFWHKQVVIKASIFGGYEVLYVRYPGLPPSPPSGISIIDDGPYSGNNNNARTIKPLGVDPHKRHQNNGLGAGMIAIIALSGSVALILCSAVAWVFLVRHRGHNRQRTPTLQPLPSSVAKPSGTTGSANGSGLSSTSLSFGSSIAPYTGSAKTFSASEIENATKNFDASRIIGEGGFGLVYSGILEDGTKVAVKVLKRDDNQGGREFLAEVEMLSRLHHRNLVKLIGICTEERSRCLVYELIPNGSVESHLHGADEKSVPLDWDTRIKIALGAARGLAYLHEDSSPRVIHRDFKASNILLENDFTPKVSDFGLARTAMDEEHRHISTRVMGTFGYVAPEYAMTGHLLVKSDVYSYGVVLLELLSGRKPVDMSQPPGQENLVAWARPLLTSREGLEIMTDPSLGPDVPFDSVAKVAAIASMCVQPEVSHRPFMGEVVQALKLVCNECDEAKEDGSGSSSRDLSIDMDSEAIAGSEHLLDPFRNQPVGPDYDSEPDMERGLSMSLFSASVRYGRQETGSFRRYSSSGPLRTGRGKHSWQRMRRLTGESVSEHGDIFRQWPGSH